MKTMSFVFSFLVLTHFSFAELNGDPGTYISNAHVGSLIQNEDGLCYVQLVESEPGSSGYRWVWLDANSVVGTAFLSKILLSKSKSYTGMMVRFVSSASMSVPDEPGVLAYKIGSLKL